MRKNPPKKKVMSVSLPFLAYDYSALFQVTTELCYNDSEYILHGHRAALLVAVRHKKGLLLAKLSTY